MARKTQLRQVSFVVGIDDGNHLPIRFVVQQDVEIFDVLSHLVLFSFCVDDQYLKPCNFELVDVLPPQLAKYGGFYTFRSLADILFYVGMRLGVRPKMRLAGGRQSTMCDELMAFFVNIIPHLNGIGVRRRFSLPDVAKALYWLGVTSAEGRVVSKDHVSNAIRKVVKRIGPVYEKPTYMDNWRRFPHRRQPMHVRFSNER